MTVEASMMIGRKKNTGSAPPSTSSSQSKRPSKPSPLHPNTTSNFASASLNKPINTSSTSVRKRNSILVSNNYLDLKLVLQALSKGDIPTSYPALFTIRTSCHLYYKLWNTLTYTSSMLHQFILHLLECEMPEGIDGKSEKGSNSKKKNRTKMDGLGLWAFGMMVNHASPQLDTFQPKNGSQATLSEDAKDYQMFHSDKHGDLLHVLLENLMVLLLLSPHYSEASNTIKLLYKKFPFDLSLLFSIDLNKFQVPGKVSDHNFISLLHLIDWCIKHDSSSTMLLKTSEVLLKLVSHILHHCDTSFFLVNSSTFFHFCFSYCYSFYYKNIAPESNGDSSLWPTIPPSLFPASTNMGKNEELLGKYKSLYESAPDSICPRLLIDMDSEQEVKDYVQVCGNLIVIFRYLAGINIENRNFLASFSPLRWCLQASFHNSFDQDITRELMMLLKILYSDFNIRAVVEMKSSGVKVSHISSCHASAVFSPSNPLNYINSNGAEFAEENFERFDGRVSTSTCSEDSSGIWLLSLSELYHLLTQNKYHLLDVLAEIYIDIFEVSFLFSDEEMRYCLGCFSENKRKTKTGHLNQASSHKELNLIDREMHPDHELFLIRLFDAAIEGVEKSIEEDRLNREFLQLDENVQANPSLSSTADAAIRNTSAECLYRILFKFERSFHVMSDRTTLLNSKTKILRLILKVLQQGPNLWRISFLHLLECAVILFRSIDPIWLGFSLSDSDKCLVNTSLALQYWGEILLEDDEKSRNFDQKDLECWNYLIGNDRMNHIHELFSAASEEDKGSITVTQNSGENKLPTETQLSRRADSDDDGYGNDIDISATLDDEMPHGPYTGHDDDDDYNIGGVSISPDSSPFTTQRKTLKASTQTKDVSSPTPKALQDKSHRVYMLRASNHHGYLKIAKEFLSKFASEFLPSISTVGTDWDIMTPSERCRGLLNFYYCIQILGYEVVKLNTIGVDNMIGYLWSIVSGGAEYGVLKVSRIDLQCVHLLGILIEQKAIHFASNKLVNPSPGISRRENPRSPASSTQTTSDDPDHVLASDESEFFIENLSHIFPDASKFADCLVNILRLRPEDVAFAISTATDKSHQWEKLQQEVTQWQESNKTGEMPLPLRQQQYLLQVHNKYVSSLSRWHIYDPHPDIHTAALSSIFRVSQLDANIRHKLLKFLPEILTLINIFSPLDPITYIPCLTLLKTMIEYVSKLELHAEEKIVELLIRCLSPQHPVPKLVSPHSISTNFYHFNLRKNNQSSRHANRLYLHAYACELIYLIGQESPGFIFRGISRLEIEDPIIAVLKLALDDVSPQAQGSPGKDLIVSPSLPTVDQTNAVSSRYTKVVLHSLKALTTIVHNFNIKPSWLPSPLLYHWSHYTSSLSSRPILQPSLLPLVFSLLSNVRVHYRLAYFTYFLNLASCIMYACSDGSVCPNSEEDVNHLNNLKEISTQQVLPCLPLALDFIMLLQKKKQHVQLWRSPRHNESLMLNRSASSQALSRVQSNAQFGSLKHVSSSGAFNSLRSAHSSSNFMSIKSSPSLGNFGLNSHQSTNNLAISKLDLNSDDDIDLDEMHDELRDEFVPNEWVIEELPTIESISHSKVPIAISLLMELGILGASSDSRKYRVISQSNLRSISSNNLNRLASSKSLANISNMSEETPSQYPSSLSTYTHTHALTMLTLQAITCVSVFVCNQDKSPLAGYQRFKQQFVEKPLVSVVCSLIHSQSELDEEMMLAIENSSVVLPNSIRTASSINNLHNISSNNLVAMGNEDSNLNMVMIKTQNLPMSPLQILQNQHSRTRLCKMNLRMQQQAVRKGVEMLKYFSQNEIELLAISLQAPHALLATIKISQETNNFHANELQSSLCKIITAISNSQQLLSSPNVKSQAPRSSSSGSASSLSMGFNLKAEHIGCENLMRCRVQDALVAIIETKHKESSRNAVVALHHLTLRLPYLVTLLEEPPLPLENLMILKKQSVPKKPSSNKLDKIHSSPNLLGQSNGRVKLSAIHAFEKNPLVTYKGRLRLVDSIFRLAEQFNKDLKIIVFCLRFLMHFEQHFPNEWRELFTVPPRYFYQQLVQNNNIAPSHIHTSPTTKKKTIHNASTYTFTIDGFYNPYYSEWHEILRNMKRYLSSIVRVEEWQWQSANQGQDPLNSASCCFAISTVPSSAYSNSIAATHHDLISSTAQSQGLAYNYSSYLYMYTVTGESLKENFVTKAEVEDILASKFWQTQDKCRIM